MTRPAAKHLDALIDDLTTDAYGDEEQLSGFIVGADEALVRGERASIVGVDLEVVGVDGELGLVVVAYPRWQGRR